MITEKELKENGFVPVGEWCNRTYYKKQGFEIVEHQGIFYESDEENWSGDGEELKTIEDVNSAHKNYIRRKFNKFKALFG